jgi:curved DNA-binding protein CbpA
VTLYGILGLNPNAGDDAIRAAYRLLARRFHPDAGEDASAEKFREITEAYETLSDPQRRRVYDRSLQPPPPSFPPAFNVRIEPMTAEPMRIERMTAPPFADPLDALFDDLLRIFFDRRF